MKKHSFVIICIIALITVIAVQACSKKTNEVAEVIKTEENSTETTEKVTIAGNVKSLNSSTKTGCFFVDPEMVEAGVVEGLGSKAIYGKCNDIKFGKGVEINFTTLDPKSNYPTLPSENVLLLFQGHWKQEVNAAQEQINTFYVTEYEPFF